jgi:hypothetical protein
VISRPTGLGWLRSIESKRPQIELVDESIDSANGVVLSDPVVETLGK